MLFLHYWITFQLFNMSNNFVGTLKSIVRKTEVFYFVENIQVNKTT